MILIGRLLSPYVRRVATTMNLYDMPFEVLDDNQVIVESSAILDYLDREVGAERALIPASGQARTQTMSMLGVATGAIDKAISVAYEARFRPEEKRHPEWVERCEGQAREGFEWLESQLDGDWFLGNKMSQLDLTTAVGWQFVSRGTPALHASINAPKIEALTQRMNEIEAFSSTFPA